MASERWEASSHAFKRPQVDETAISKRKYNRGKRTRQAGTEWMEVEVEVSPSKKARKVIFI